MTAMPKAFLQTETVSVRFTPGFCLDAPSSSEYSIIITSFLWGIKEGIQLPPKGGGGGGLEIQRLLREEGETKPFGGKATSNRRLFARQRPSSEDLSSGCSLDALLGRHLGQWKAVVEKDSRRRSGEIGSAAYERPLASQKQFPNPGDVYFATHLRRKVKRASAADFSTYYWSKSPRPSRGASRSRKFKFSILFVEYWDSDILYWTSKTADLVQMDFIAGAIGGGVSAAVGYPLDTIKVRIQTEARYHGMWHCIRDTYRTERVPGFFRGASMTIVMASLIASFSFGVYKNCLCYICRLRYGSADRKPSKVDISFAGCVTGAVRVVLISPAEIAKVRLQTQKEPHGLMASSHSLDYRPKYQGAVHCLQTIVKEEGFAGLYKGSLALLGRDCHSCSVYFLTYSVLCDWLTPAGKNRPDLWAVLLSGGCAGVLAWSTATPMDVIKARMQADGNGQRKYTGFIHCARDSIREEGVRVLFKGLVLNSLRAFPANMTIFLTYEAVLRLGEHLRK